MNITVRTGHYFEDADALASATVEVIIGGVIFVHVCDRDSQAVELAVRIARDLGLDGAEINWLHAWKD